MKKCEWLKFGLEHCTHCNWCECKNLSEDDKKRVYHIEEYKCGLDGDR